jgi:hypothetical protein
MTEADLANLEAALGVTLPAFYRQFMLDYPADLLTATYGPDGQPGEPADDWLHYKPETIIRDNQEARQHLAFERWNGSAYAPDPWPTNFLVIGSDGGGDCWFIKLDEGSQMVWRYYHERGRYRLSAISLAQYADRLRQLFVKFRQGEF